MTSDTRKGRGYIQSVPPRENIEISQKLVSRDQPQIIIHQNFPTRYRSVQFYGIRSLLQQICLKRSAETSTQDNSGKKAKTFKQVSLLLTSIFL